ncbi:MAG TPA: FUSC family protein [Chthoniobacterales bacterium]
MSVLTDASAPDRRHGWLEWLRRELAPYPGRETMTLRMVVTIVLVTIVSMALRVPEAALSAYMVFFVSKENRVLTALAGVLLTVGVTIGIGVSLVLYRYTFDFPQLRIPVMALTVFAAMYLSRVFAIGPLGFAIGFVVAVTQSIADTISYGELLVRALLWLWVVILYPIALTVVTNHFFLPAHPWTALVRALTQRLDAVSSELKRVVDEGFAGGAKDVELLELATRGSSSLVRLLGFAESKDAQLKRRHSQIFAVIAGCERLVSSAAVLKMRGRIALTENDRRCAGELIVAVSRIQTALGASDPFAGSGSPMTVAPSIPELQEFRLAVESLGDALTLVVPETLSSAKKPRKPLFVADALTNPAHARFALKVTLAAMSCYVIYTGLDWFGIHTAFITCCFIALENTGATLRKGWLRLIGCSAGGLLGFLAILYLVPHMESIVSLALLAAAGSAVAGWVAAGSDRIAYAGLQIAFAFYMCIFQGFGPDTSFDVIRDRFVGIVLGIVVSSVVFRYVWPERAVDRLRSSLGSTLRKLASLLLIPEIGASVEAKSKVAAESRLQVAEALNESLRLLELAAFEDRETLRLDGLSPRALESVVGRTQGISLIATMLSGETELAEWRQLEKTAQEAEAALRRSAAEQLRRVAAFVENGTRLDSGDFKFAIATWENAVSQIAVNDRTRFVRRLVEQIRHLIGSLATPGGSDW